MLDTAPTTTMGVARGGTWAMATKIYKFNRVSPILLISQKRRTTVGWTRCDVIETQTMKDCLPQTFLTNSVPGLRYLITTKYQLKWKTWLITTRLIKNFECHNTQRCFQPSSWQISFLAVALCLAEFSPNYCAVAWNTTPQNFTVNE